MIKEGGKAEGAVSVGHGKLAAVDERMGAPRFRYHFELWTPDDDDRELAVYFRERRDAALRDGFDALAARFDMEYQALLHKRDAWDFSNQITTVGKNDLLDKYFSGSGYTAAWYMGLVDVDSFSAYNAGDTMASHAGWVESTEYSNANRITVTFAAASAGAKAITGTLDFNINASTGIQGAFLVTNNTKGGSTGILYSVGTFSGGARTGLQNGDTLKVSGSWSV